MTNLLNQILLLNLTDGIIFAALLNVFGFLTIGAIA